MVRVRFLKYKHRSDPDPATWYLTLMCYSSHNAGLPVIKLDRYANVIYANRASFHLLADLGLLASKRVPAALLRAFPCLMDLQASETIRLETAQFVTRLYVIGYPEAGYIGLYAFQQSANPFYTNYRAGLAC
jgi:hypothetical protein